MQHARWPAASLRALVSARRCTAVGTPAACQPARGSPWPHLAGTVLQHLGGPALCRRARQVLPHPGGAGLQVKVGWVWAAVQLLPLWHIHLPASERGRGSS